MADNKSKRDQELAALREKKLTTLFNRHFSEAAAAIAAERKAAEVALREIERRRAEAALKLANNPKKDADVGQTLTKLDEMYLELKRREESVRRRERDTLQKYHKYMNKGESTDFFLPQKVGQSAKGKQSIIKSTSSDGTKGVGTYDYANSDIEKGNVDKNVKKFNENETTLSPITSRKLTSPSGNVKSAADKLNNLNNSVTFTEEEEVHYPKSPRKAEYDPENPLEETKPLTPKKKTSKTMSISEEALFQNAKKAAAMAEHDGKVEESNLQAKVAEQNARKMAKSMSSWGQEDEFDNLTVTSYGNSSFGESGSITTANSLANSQGSSLVFISEAEMRLTAFLKANTEAIASLSNHVQSTSDEYSETNSLFSGSARKEYDNVVLAAEKAARDMAATVLLTSSASVITENTVAKKKRKEKWYQYWSEEHSREYYFQPSTGKVVWEPPAEYEDSGTMVKKRDIEQNITTEEEKIQYNVQNWSMDDFLPERKGRKKSRKFSKRSSDESSRASWGSRRSKGSRGSKGSKGSKGSRSSRSINPNRNSVPLPKAILSSPKKDYSIWNSKNRKLRKKVVRRTIWGLVFTGVAYKTGTHTYSFYTSNNSVTQSPSSEQVPNINSHENTQILSKKKKGKDKKNIDGGVPKIIETKSKKTKEVKIIENSNVEQQEKKARPVELNKNVKRIDKNETEKVQESKNEIKEAKSIESKKSEHKAYTDVKIRIDEEVQNMNSEETAFAGRNAENNPNPNSNKGETQKISSSSFVDYNASKEKFNDVELNGNHDLYGTGDMMHKESAMEHMSEIMTSEIESIVETDLSIQKKDSELSVTEKEHISQPNSLRTNDSILKDAIMGKNSSSESEITIDDNAKQGDENYFSHVTNIEVDDDIQNESFISTVNSPESTSIKDLNLSRPKETIEYSKKIDGEGFGTSERNLVQNELQNLLHTLLEVNESNDLKEQTKKSTIDKPIDLQKEIFEQKVDHKTSIDEDDADYLSSNGVEITSSKISDNENTGNIIIETEIQGTMSRLAKLKHDLGSVNRINDDVLNDGGFAASTNNNTAEVEKTLVAVNDQLQKEVIASVENLLNQTFDGLEKKEYISTEQSREDHVVSMSLIKEEKAFQMSKNKIEAKNAHNSQFITPESPLPVGKEIVTETAQGNIPFKTDTSEENDDRHQVNEKRPRHCNVPLMYLLSRVCNFHAKENPLFDLEGLTDTMMQ